MGRPRERQSFGRAFLLPRQPARDRSGRGRGDHDRGPAVRRDGYARGRPRPSGRLQRFRSVPPQFDESGGAAPPPPWNTLFEAAGLSMSSFADAAPHWAPPDYADVRAAWTGRIRLKDVTLRIEGAAYRGKPSSRGHRSVDRSERMQPDRESLADRVFVALVFLTLGVLMASAAVLARRHIRPTVPIVGGRGA